MLDNDSFGKSKSPNRAFLLIAAICTVAMVSSLVYFAERANSRGEWLYDAAQSGDLLRTESPLSQDGNPNLQFNGATPLWAAVENNDLAMAKLLLTRHAHPNIVAGGGTASDMASSRKMKQLIRSFAGRHSNNP